MLTATLAVEPAAAPRAGRVSHQAGLFERSEQPAWAPPEAAGGSPGLPFPSGGPPGALRGHRDGLLAALGGIERSKWRNANER